MIIPEELTTIFRIKNKSKDNRNEVNPIVRIRTVDFLEGAEMANPSDRQREKIKNIFKPNVILKLVSTAKKAGRSRNPYANKAEIAKANESKI